MTALGSLTKSDYLVFMFFLIYDLLLNFMLEIEEGGGRSKMILVDMQIYAVLDLQIYA